ncbi:MAG TPA: hypothetical protein PLO69_14170 [Gammaproteobacteria bacterium]|nr:hypothetical protein [Gammaproteobacteria bacterium]
MAREADHRLAAAHFAQIALDYPEPLPEREPQIAREPKANVLRHLVPRVHGATSAPSGLPIPLPRAGARSGTLEHYLPPRLYRFFDNY